MEQPVRARLRRADRVGHVWPVGLGEEGDGGVGLGGQDVHQGVAVPVQGHAGAGLQQLPAHTYGALDLRSGRKHGIAFLGCP